MLTNILNVAGQDPVHVERGKEFEGHAVTVMKERSFIQYTQYTQNDRQATIMNTFQ